MCDKQILDYLDALIKHKNSSWYQFSSKPTTDCDIDSLLNQPEFKKKI
jgi:hypothetical protein